jgi:hypothetical protein
VLTPEQLAGLPGSVVEMYRDLEEYIIADIARRIAKASGMTDTAHDQVNIARGLGTSLKDVEKRVAEVTGMAKEEAERLIREAVEGSIEAESVMYVAAGRGTSEVLSPTLSRILDEGIRQTLGELDNFSGTMGFAYVDKGKTVFSSLTEMYRRESDLAIMKMRSGASDRRTATRQAVTRLSERGLVSIDYESGHTDSVDVAVERAIRTGASQMALQCTEAMADQLGAEYVEVTAHQGARPDHAVWQGRVFHRGGAEGAYPDFETTTGYGTGPGLGGWNCRHSWFPFFPGVSERTYTDEELETIDPPPFEYEGKTYTHYEATQAQRAFERKIRGLKRQLIGHDASVQTGVEGAKMDFQNASIKMQRYKQAYKAFSNAAGLAYRDERTWRPGFTRSIAQKAVWAVRRDVEKYARVRYNADGTIVVTDSIKRRAPANSRPNAVIDITNEKGSTSRVIYDETGRQKQRIHPSDHGFPAHHPADGHVHDVEYDEKGNMISGSPARELTPEERKIHGNLL